MADTSLSATTFELNFCGRKLKKRSTTTFELKNCYRCVTKNVLQLLSSESSLTTAITYSRAHRNNVMIDILYSLFIISCFSQVLSLIQALKYF